MNRRALAAALYVLAAAAQVRPVGVVTAIDGGRLTLKTDDGHEVKVIPQSSATYLRVQPGAKDLSGAAKIAAGDIGVGDRVLARGKLSEDQKIVDATSVVVMTQADVAKKHAADNAEWQRRGTTGVIKSVNAAANEIVITQRSGEMTVALGAAVLKRYAPDSVRFADAKPSEFGALRVGDQVRALGTRSEDGKRFTADELVSGAFRNLALQVVSVDAGANTAQVKDLDSKKTLTLNISPDSSLRRLPPFVAQMMAMRNAGGARPAGGGPPGGGPPGGFGGGRGNPSEMLDRMPAFPFSELKPGDALIVAATQSSDPGRITAITVLAGVEPILAAAPAGGRQMALGNWNLDLNMNMGPM
jgi:hypothetical protein